MPRILLINGPNLNNLGKRDQATYGNVTLPEIETACAKRASSLGLELATFQSNHEGAIIDFLQREAPASHGVVINGGAFTHTSVAIRDALTDARLPIVEVHLSNIHAREPFRHVSMTAPIAVGQIAGLGWRGYTYALDFLAAYLSEHKKP